MTTPAQAKRIVMLDEAWAQLPDLRKGMRRRKPENGYNYRNIAIDVGDGCDSGRSCDGGIEIDLETADLLLPIIEKLIKDELRKLGVKP